METFRWSQGQTIILPSVLPLWTEVFKHNLLLNSNLHDWYPGLSIERSSIKHGSFSHIAMHLSTQVFKWVLACDGLTSHPKGNRSTSSHLMLRKQAIGSYLMGSWDWIKTFPSPTCYSPRKETEHHTQWKETFFTLERIEPAIFRLDHHYSTN